MPLTMDQNRVSSNIGDTLLCSNIGSNIGAIANIGSNVCRSGVTWSFPSTSAQAAMNARVLKSEEVAMPCRVQMQTYRLFTSVACKEFAHPSHKIRYNGNQVISGGYIVSN